jgi:cytochrome b subunit of formate dehydrogenase
MLLKVLYWLAVVAISLALVVGLILWFESQDASEVEGSLRDRTFTTSA